MDVTALLIAARLDLLDYLEAHPGGVAIPAGLPMLLLAMEDGCRERSDATVAERMLAASVRPDGIDGEPVTRIVAEEDGGAAVVEDLGADTRSFPQLVAALAERRIVDADTASELVDGLPSVDAGRGGPFDGPLLLDAASLRRLASVDALGAAAAAFDLRCDGGMLDAARSACDGAAVARQASATLASLRAWVAAGLATGAVRPLPEATQHGGDGANEEEEDGLETAVTRCLRDVIAAPPIENGLAWIDDRTTTGYARTDSMPVVGVADVLEALRLDGALTEAACAAKLAELRGAGALFMVPAADEVAAALVAAPSRGQLVVETPRLEAIRRSVALLALHERNLAVGAGRPSDRPDEVVPMQTAMRLLPNCLQAVWVDDGLDFDGRVARSDWLWLNVRRAHVGRLLPGEDRPATQAKFEAIQLAHCLDQGTDIGLVDDRRRAVRLQYLQWVWWRAVEPLAQVDETLIQRLADYLAEFYDAMARDYDRRGGLDRRILLSLLARRVHRLPDPIQTRLYADPRMRRFGVTSEQVTIGRLRLPPETFWREMRRAVRYGSGRLRVRDDRGRLRRVRMRRQGTHVLLTGAVRARIGDAVVAIVAARDVDRPSAIGSFVADLRLPAADAERVRAQAHHATTPARLAAVLKRAQEISATARHSDIVAKLARRERFRLDILAPAPFPSILSAMSLVDTDAPFGEALSAARRDQDTRAPLDGLLATAGIPVLRDDPAGVELDRWVERARTPLALVHTLAAAVATGRPDGDLRQLAERLAAATERGGHLFATLLRWTHRFLLRDADWRAAPPAYALAAVWGHADRVLDAAMGGGIALEPLRESLEQSNVEVAGVDLLWLQPPGTPDVAWPAWMTRAALLHHGLAAAFAGRDLRPVLGDELMERLRGLQLFGADGVVGCETRLLLRRDDWPNAMGSLLVGSPKGFDEGDLDRATIRRRLVGSALDAVEAEPDEHAPWLQLAAFASSGADADQAERIKQLAGDAPRLVRLVSAGLDEALWRGLVQPVAWIDRGEAAQVAVSLALACRRLTDAGRASTRLAHDVVARELVELASIVAAASGDARERAFADLLDEYAQAWPALRGILHQTIGNLLASTPSARADELWRLHNRLGAR